MPLEVETLGGRIGLAEDVGVDLVSLSGVMEARVSMTATLRALAAASHSTSSSRSSVALPIWPGQSGKGRINKARLKEKNCKSDN